MPALTPSTVQPIELSPTSVIGVPTSTPIAVTATPENTPTFDPCDSHPAHGRPDRYAAAGGYRYGGAGPGYASADQYACADQYIGNDEYGGAERHGIADHR